MIPTHKNAKVNLKFDNGALNGSINNLKWYYRKNTQQKFTIGVIDCYNRYITSHAKK